MLAVALATVSTFKHSASLMNGSAASIRQHGDAASAEDADIGASLDSATASVNRMMLLVFYSRIYDRASCAAL